MKKITASDTLETLRAMGQDEDTPDHLNPVFALSTTSNDVLAAMARGDVDLKVLVRMELAKRGIDLNGEWIGFEAAKENFSK